MHECNVQDIDKREDRACCVHELGRFFWCLEVHTESLQRVESSHIRRAALLVVSMSKENEGAENISTSISSLLHLDIPSEKWVETQPSLTKSQHHSRILSTFKCQQHQHQPNKVSQILPFHPMDLSFPLWSKCVYICMNKAIQHKEYQGIPMLQVGCTTRYLGVMIGLTNTDEHDWQQRMTALRAKLAMAARPAIAERGGTDRSAERDHATSGAIHSTI